MLAAQMIAPIRVMETLKPAALTKRTPGVWIFDMGQNMVGWCRLKVSGAERHGSSAPPLPRRCKPDGTLYLDNIRSAKVTDTYTLKGRGRGSVRAAVHLPWVPLRRGDRLSRGARRCRRSKARWSTTPWRARGEFTCSNPLLNRIYKNIVWGVSGNYRSIPTDCPQRDERQGWLGDRSAESQGETYLFDVAALYAKWVDDMADSQDEKGRVSDVSPAYWPFRNDNVTWPSSFIIVPDHLYDQYGDLQVIAKHYEGMKKWIAHMQTLPQRRSHATRCLWRLVRSAGISRIDPFE